ncbi:hypothetical protein RB618_17370, partial [Flavobacterium sp. LHD-85]|nr:hypothetical protein [Flavobacterium sp. LHD-85]
MKNKLLLFLLFLSSYLSYSQVGIGTVMPNTSSQLEVAAADKGILIPRIKLTSITDVTTIANGNVSSLLVFNTATISDVTPGYYYWYENKWNRIIVSNEITATPGTVIYNPSSQLFTHVNTSGNAQSLDINAIVRANESLTTVVNNGGGLYTYTNEAGTKVNINIVGDVKENFTTIANEPAVIAIIQNIANKTEGNVVFDSTLNQFSYISASGIREVVDIGKIVKNNETITTLGKNLTNKGKYLYTSEDNTVTEIDVIQDVVANSATILNNSNFKSELVNVVKLNQTTTTLAQSTSTGGITYTNEDGTAQTAAVRSSDSGNIITV